MPVNKIEIEALKGDIVKMQQNFGNPSSTALEALKIIELRRLNSNLEYLGSIMEHAPWNLKGK